MTPEESNVRVSQSNYVATEQTVEHLPEAKTFFRKRQIHPRRIIPTVEEGEMIEDNTPEESHLNFVLRSAAAAVAPPITIIRKTQIPQVAAMNTSSTVGEPSVAAHGNVIFFTGNWYAALSQDGGATFVYIDPYTSFPNPAGMQFCCDQIAHYIPSIDTFVWLLQYDGTSNIQRVAYATTANVLARRWKFFDITPASLGFPGGFVDFPDIAIGKNMLYTTTNVFQGTAWVGSVVVRIPIQDLVTGNINAQHAAGTTPADFSFRVCQNCDTTAFWASHKDTSHVRVYSWPETAPNPTFRDVGVAKWVAGPYVSNTPDGHNWLGRADRRMTGATKRGNEIWFAWAASPGGANQRPQPYVQIARIDATTFQLLENINIWDQNQANCYAALTTGANNDVAACYAMGGGGHFTSHVVAFLTAPALHTTVYTSIHGPANDSWGDYLTVRLHNPDTNVYSAAGYTLQLGTGPQNATPDYVSFRR